MTAAALKMIWVWNITIWTGVMIPSAKLRIPPLLHLPLVPPPLHVQQYSSIIFIFNYNLARSNSFQQKNSISPYETKSDIIVRIKLISLS